MSSWNGKTKGGVTGHKIFVYFLKNFGLSFSYFILRFVSVYFVFFSKERKYIFFYFNKIQSYSYFKSVIYLFKNYYIFGQTLLDKVALLGNVKNKITFNFDGENYLHEMVSAGNGGILISAHIGNWEIAGNLLNRLNTKVNIVMYDAEHENIKKYISKVINNDEKINIIIIKDDFSHIFAISNALKKNELICIHGDRYVPGSKTISTTFFKKPVKLPAGPFHLAFKFKVPYTYVFAMKENRNHYHFFATPPKYIVSSLEMMVKEYTNSLENMLQKYPEQWFNYFKFWND